MWPRFAFNNYILYLYIHTYNTNSIFYVKTFIGINYHCRVLISTQQNFCYCFVVSYFQPHLRYTIHGDKSSTLFFLTFLFSLLNIIFWTLKSVCVLMFLAVASSKVFYVCFRVHNESTYGFWRFSSVNTNYRSELSRLFI